MINQIIILGRAALDVIKRTPKGGMGAAVNYTLKKTAERGGEIFVLTALDLAACQAGRMIARRIKKKKGGNK